MAGTSMVGAYEKAHGSLVRQVSVPWKECPVVESYTCRDLQSLQWNGIYTFTLVAIMKVSLPSPK